MASVIADFFSITGVNMYPPETLSELLPWLVTIVVGVALVSGAFGVIGKLLNLILDYTRWK